MQASLRNIAKKIKISEKTVNFLLIFILGFLVGVAVKTEARNRITIGYSDYLAGQMRQDFDLMDNTAENGVKSENSKSPAESQGDTQN